MVIGGEFHVVGVWVVGVESVDSWVEMGEGGCRLVVGFWLTIVVEQDCLVVAVMRKGLFRVVVWATVV